MNAYEEILQLAYEEGFYVIEAPLYSPVDGFCYGNDLYINTRRLDTTTQKRCVLGEERWHGKKTVGDISDQTKVENVKQERFARKCCYYEYMHPDKIVKALLSNCTNIQEMCEYLNVTEEYFYEAIEYYKQKYGLFYRCKDYTLYFEPLYVIGSSIQGDENI